MNGLVYPKPRDWNDLEDMATDVFSREIQDGNLIRFKRFGRQGQAQQGVDIVGFDRNRVIGLQCKNHVQAKVSWGEIADQIRKADKFSPKLSELIVVTSSNRDARIHSRVIKRNKERRARRQCPISMIFWEDFCELIFRYPDLTYKYFTRHFPTSGVQNVTLPDANRQNRLTLSVRARGASGLQEFARERGVYLSDISPYEFTGRNTVEFKSFVSQVLPELLQRRLRRPSGNRYNPSIGFTTFDSVCRRDIADLDINFAHLLSDGKNTNGFNRAVQALRDVRDILSQPFFSKDLTIYLQSRLTHAFLLGWMFRKSAHFNLNLVSGNQIWSTKDLPHVPTKILEKLPEVGSRRSNDVVLVLNFATRDTLSVVKRHLKRSGLRFRILLNYALDDSHVHGAAHALSIAVEISRKLKNIFDHWGIGSVHLFGSVPAALATLIGYHLNAIKPINLYYLDQARTNYVLGGTISNNT